MKILSFAKAVLGVLMATELLAGCSSGATRLAPAASGLQMSKSASRSNSQTIDRPTTRLWGGSLSVNPNHGPSWMDPSAKTGRLLYISDAATNTVVVYAFPSLKLTGTLTGFDNPQGECVDGAGNIWIANTEMSQLLEYAHGGTTPIATLNDPNEYPVGCSVDPTTGDLAASNLYSTNGPPGSVAIFKKAAGDPTLYAPPGFADVYFLGYDSKSTLYLDGIDSGSGFLFASFNGKMFTDITLQHAIGGPGAVQAIGNDVAVGDQTIGANAAYTFAINGSTGKLKKTTLLTGATDVVQFYIRKKALVGGDFNPGGSSTVDTFRYPAGGSPTKSAGGVSAPIGAAISG